MENVKFRLKFGKFDRMRFIGHLDLLKLFQRTVNKAGLPVSYSKGFNPHQLMAFALPLPLGYESCGEYVDIQFDEDLAADEIKRRLNEAFPYGIEILDIKKADSREKSAALLQAAAYEIHLYNSVYKPDERIPEILSSREIFVERRNKKGTKTVDIRPDIFEIRKVSEDCIYCMLSAGSERNLKAEAVASLFYADSEIIEKKLLKYKRLEMYKRLDGEFVALG